MPEPRERIAALIERRADGAAASLLPILLGLPPEQAQLAAGAARDLRQVGARWTRSAVLAGLSASALAAVQAHHRSDPAGRGMPLETLRRELHAPEELVERTLADLASAGRLRIASGVAALPGFSPQVEGGDAEVDRVVRLLEEAALSPPSLAELATLTGRRDVAAILRLAAASGRVEAVERERYYARPALDRFTAALAEVGASGPIAPADLRDRLGISRKFMIPLLEWADAKGITERVGDARRLRRA